MFHPVAWMDVGILLLMCQYSISIKFERISLNQLSQAIYRHLTTSVCNIVNIISIALRENVLDHETRVPLVFCLLL